jgi:hypothetical protein
LRNRIVLWWVLSIVGSYASEKTPVTNEFVKEDFPTEKLYTKVGCDSREQYSAHIYGRSTYLRGNREWQFFDERVLGDFYCWPSQQYKLRPGQ